MLSVQIATLPQRVDSLKATIRSLYDQVDAIHVMLNGHEVIPIFDDPAHKIHPILLKNEYGDAAKFLNFNERNGFVFSCDDDIIYPKDYCSYMIYKYNQYIGHIITLHGKVFQRPVRSAHRYFRENYHCLSTIDGDHVVDTGGTGVMLLNTNDIKISISDFPKPNMADIWLAKLAKEQGRQITVVAHAEGWLRYTSPGETIWSAHTKEQDAYQVQVLNSFINEPAKVFIAPPATIPYRTIPKIYGAPIDKRIGKQRYLRRRYGNRYPK